MTGPEKLDREPGDTSPADLPTHLAAGSLNGQHVLVIGGGGSIGRSIAWLAGRLGAKVAIAGRKMEKLEAVCGAMTARGLSSAPYQVDIRNRESVEALYDRLEAEAGLPDILVQSAGGQFPAPAIDYTEKGWKAVIETNLDGTFRVMQCAAQRWRKAGRGGSIANIVVSPRGLHGVAHTCAARAGVIAFSEQVAIEWAPLGIRVNCIAPGAIRSEGWAVYKPEVRALYENGNPLRQVGSPWQIAEATLFVAGPGGAFISGETLEVTGAGHLWGEIWTIGKPEWFREATQALDGSPGKS